MEIAIADNITHAVYAQNVMPAMKKHTVFHKVIAGKIRGCVLVTHVQNTANIIIRIITILGKPTVHYPVVGGTSINLGTTPTNITALIEITVGDSIVIGAVLKPQKLIQIVKINPLHYNVRLPVKRNTVRCI